VKTLSRIGLLLILATVSACSTSPTPGNAPYLLTADAAAAGLQQVSVTADTGEMRITASGDDTIHVKLDLNQDQKSFLGIVHWMSDSTAHDLEAATIKLDRQGSAMRVTLAYPSGGTHSDVKQKWTLTVPARLVLESSMDAGRMVIDGAAGGIAATLGAGDLEIHSPKGAVHASVKAGRLHVISDSAKPGAIRVASSFGLAILDLNGKYYGPPEEHGFMSSLHFWGNSVAQQGGGGDDMQLKVFAGLADLRVGAVGGVKDYRKAFTDD